MSLAVAHKALALWDLAGAEVGLVAQRENQVFKVSAQDGQRYALRLHRRGYHSDVEIASELDWSVALSEGGIGVPLPIRSAEGQFLHVVDGVQVDLLTWLDGEPMGSMARPLDLENKTGVFTELGKVMARVHAVSDAWTPPDGFARRRWDADGLIGEAPVWDRFWDNPVLTPDQRDLMLEVRARAGAVLEEHAGQLDYGLIHADLVRENVLINAGQLQLIDFDDSGFGFRLFDVATTLGKNHDEPDRDLLQAAFLDGYRSERVLDTSLLPLFMLLRACTYLGWIITRMDEPGSQQRCQRFVRIATELAGEYLGQSNNQV